MCTGGDVQVFVSGTITISSAATVAMVTYLDGEEQDVVVLAEPADFVAVGRMRQASFQVADLYLPTGYHRMGTCFVLMTDGVLSTLGACLPTTDYDLACSTDSNPPSITGSRSPEPNAAGWNNEDVTVSFECSDAEGVIASCSQPVLVSTEGAAQSVTGEVIDGAGNASQLTVSGINIDKTAPSIALNGLRTYDADEWIAIDCDIVDELSGVASSSCGVSVPAYTYAAGEHTITATARDYAGNAATATGTFTVVASADAVSNLIGDFLENPGVANSLSQKIAAARFALEHGSEQAAANMLSAFDNQVNAQTGKTLTLEQAAYLLQLSQQLLPH